MTAMIFRWLRNRRRKRLLIRPYPAEQWHSILNQNFRYWRLLDSDERERLLDLIRIFIAERYWEGCGGLDLTDEVRVTVAAQACLLILNLDVDSFNHVRTILVYPTGYFAPNRTAISGGVVIESTAAVLGQAHLRGPVILSWKHVRRGGRDHSDGHNLVYHEFAHKLDMADGVIDGTPRLHDRELARDWYTVMTREYEDLITWMRGGSSGGSGQTLVRPPILRPYGTTNPAEFFAVATEHFFEQPLEVRSRHPDLYEVLCRYFRQDPAERLTQ